jgi:hypothetical protein
VCAVRTLCTLSTVGAVRTLCTLSTVGAVFAVVHHHRDAKLLDMLRFLCLLAGFMSIFLSLMRLLVWLLGCFRRLGRIGLGRIRLGWCLGRLRRVRLRRIRLNCSKLSEITDLLALKKGQTLGVCTTLRTFRTRGVLL